MNKNNCGSAKEIISFIKKHNSFLIAAHIAPEGDSLGSQLAMQVLLKRLGKVSCIVNQDDVPKNYTFMPGVKNIRKVLPKGFNYDAICIVDCPVIERIGNVRRFLKGDVPIINIDHHISNSGFGKVCWIWASASSTGEMIFDLFKESGIGFDKFSALYLYVAMVVDTGSFRYSNTTGKTHAAVSQLLRFDFTPKEISRALYESHSFASRKLLALMLTSLKRTCDGKLALAALTDKMFKKTKTSFVDAEDFVNFALFIEGVEVAMLFVEQAKGLTKVSFRSNGDVDVNKIAMFFNGGGHKLASGCKIKGSLVEAQKVVLSAVRKELKMFNGK